MRKQATGLVLGQRVNNSPWALVALKYAHRMLRMRRVKHEANRRAEPCGLIARMPGARVCANLLHFTSSRARHQLGRGHTIYAAGCKSCSSPLPTPRIAPGSIRVMVDAGLLLAIAAV